MGYAARSIAIEIELPETLAAEARAQGLLEPTAREDLFGEAIRRRHVEHLPASTHRAGSREE